LQHVCSNIPWNTAFLVSCKDENCLFTNLFSYSLKKMLAAIKLKYNKHNKTNTHIKYLIIGSINIYITYQYLTAIANIKAI